MQRGVVAPFFIIALAVAVVAGGTFWFIHSKNTAREASAPISGEINTRPDAKPQVKPVVVTKPIIQSVAPQSGKVGSKVTITGINFDSKINGVMFVSKPGAQSASGFAAYVASADGKTLTFATPSQLSPCPISNPQCPTLAIAQILPTPMTYTVTVVTEKGTSNFGEFTVTK